MKVLITGVEGFVGKYLTQMLPEYFSGNVEIYGTYFVETDSLKDFKNVSLIKLDIRKSKEVEDIISTIKPDYLIHLAAQSSVGLSWKDPSLTMDVNINGTVNIFEALRKHSINSKTLIVGSSEEYGKIISNPVNEDHRLDPQNPYSVSKVSQEMLSKLYVKAYGLNIVMTRSFNHIGPYQGPLFAIPDWAKQIADIEKKLNSPVIKVGNIEVERDFTDVRDIIRAYFMLLEKGVSGEVYNIGSGVKYKLKDILDILLSYSKTPIDIEVDESKLRPAENETILCDKTKIRSIADWDLLYTIQDTLLDVLNYWRNI